MRSRFLAISVVVIGLSASLVGCGEAGSSSDSGSASGNKGCAPVQGDELVVLEDSKKLQTADNVIPAINAKAASPQLIAALDKVADELDTETLIGLNRQVDVERKTSKVVAEAFVDKTKLDQGLQKGSGTVVVGAANFGENQTLAYVYAQVLKGAGFSTSVKTIGNRELYLPELEKGSLDVVPEYAGTLTEFLNKRQSGPKAQPKASPDLAKTVAELTTLGKRAGLTFGKPSDAADQNAFAVTKKLADEKGLKTLEDFAAKCSGSQTVLGGPVECKERPFCQPGLEETYGIEFGKFTPYDTGGPLTKTALKQGKATIGLVFSSDGSLSTL
jgi:osmoprotectant transport system substrate-binding protein